MGHTALQKVGRGFAAGCTSLTTVVLPDTVTEVGTYFLYQGGGFLAVSAHAGKTLTVNRWFALQISNFSAKKYSRVWIQSVTPTRCVESAAATF